jgi:hypothetical protein
MIVAIIGERDCRFNESLNIAAPKAAEFAFSSPGNPTSPTELDFAELERTAARKKTSRPENPLAEQVFARWAQFSPLSWQNLTAEAKPTREVHLTGQHLTTAPVATIRDDAKMNQQSGTSICSEQRNPPLSV